MLEPSDLARLAAGVPVAVLLPWSLPRVSSSLWLAPALALATAAVVAAPLLPGAAGWVALLGPAVVVAATSGRRGTTSVTDPNTPTLSAAVPALLPALLVTIGALLALDASGSWQAIRDAIDNNAAVLAAAGAVTAIFLGGPVVAWVLRPFAAALGKEESAKQASSLAQAGTLIGWFERALFFALLAGGAPEAAAVALTAKSVARFPLLSKHEEGFAEYFLIGTLASLLVALAAAIAVRAALGVSAF